MRIGAQDHLEALFIFDTNGRISCTREPTPTRGPGFVLIRRADSYAWALGSGIGDEQARELAKLALDERTTSDFREPPKHVEGYLRIVGGEFVGGPAFEFPERMPVRNDAALIEDVERPQATFQGWIADEIPGRAPIMAIVDDGVPVSICFCARFYGDKTRSRKLFFSRYAMLFGTSLLTSRFGPTAIRV